jgi:hypothetical protein
MTSSGDSIEQNISTEKQYKIHIVELDGEIYPMGYRVVTENMESLGLRENPNIIKYPVGEWFCLDPEDVEPGKGDWGGIWLARIPSQAKEYRRYMWKKYSKKTKIFKAAMGDILFCNDGRVKTNAIYMFEEIFVEGE